MTTKKHKPRKPFTGKVSIEKMLAYDPQNPETSTGVPLMDAFMEALHETRAISLQDVGYYLGVDGHSLSCALEIYTGKKFIEFKKIYFEHKIKMWRLYNPKIELKEIAARLGYKDYNGLWNFLHPESHAKYREELKAIREKYNRECPN